MKTRGFTLTELTIVLGIAGAIIGGLWAIAVSANNVAKQEQMAQLVATIAYNMRGLYSGRATIETTDVEVLMPQLITKNIFPSSILKGAGPTVAVSPFGELTNQTKVTSGYRSIYVCGWSVVGVPSSRCDFGVETTNVPLFAIEAILASGAPCQNAIIRNSNPATLAGLTAVYSNGVAYTALPVTPATAAAACNAASGINHVDFVFRVAP